MLLGAVIALLANDSGVVAAATTVLYATSTLSYLVVGDLERGGDAPPTSLGRERRITVNGGALLDTKGRFARMKSGRVDKSQAG